MIWRPVSSGVAPPGEAGVAALGNDGRGRGGAEGDCCGELLRGGGPDDEGAPRPWRRPRQSVA